LEIARAKLEQASLDVELYTLRAPRPGVVRYAPGVGSLVVRALDTRDYPLIQATVLVTAVLAILVQLLVDLCYPLLDPRVRLGKGTAK
jgi:ABC-type antimicrobial peptide transport system permease subunit